jgi:hypothetical protein
MPARLRHGLALSVRVIRVIGLVTLASRAIATSEPPPRLAEYKVKAAFLVNFARFVEWPKEAFDDAGSPFVIGVLGPDPFGPDLEEALRGKTVHGRGLVIRRFNRTSDLGRCQMLFIGEGQAAKALRDRGPLKNMGVLTVGEEDGRRADTMIRFLRQDDKVRFEVDLAAAKRAGLTLSSKLLRVGKLVTPGGRD